MSDDALRSVLRDAFGRVRELVEQQCADLDERTATYRVDPGANPPIWLLWHLTRVQDDHVAGLAGTDQAWERWRERFDLPFAPDDIGFGHDADQVAAVRSDPALVAEYHADVHAATLAYLDRFDAGEVERIVDERWDPPVTAAVRLVSVVGDTLQHLGQVAFVLGVAERS
ncbi:MAG: DinB family protein [Aeromicrobium erythreum]